MSDLARAYEHCREITRSRARNFYYGLKLTPLPKRSALYAVYAFMRRCDDLADAAPDPTRAAEQIAHFRTQMEHVCAGGSVPDGEDALMWSAFADVVRTYPIDRAHLHAMLDGQAADLVKHRYANVDELRQYCYQVAGTVGLVCVSVWGLVPGADAQRVTTLAIQRGEALQLTNILRDVVEDAQRGRVYLPQDELDRFGVDLTAPVPTGDFEGLMRYQIDRAKAAYAQSAALESMLTPDCRGTAWAMMRIYRGLLDRIEADPGRVLRERVSLSPWHKMAIAWQAGRR